ncbi:MAG: hypothetical protein Q3M24_07940 [Candidatus Electrothrix aestuarii]|uniref:Glycine zipper domain-containing protein n=1 Tax=Candidatus Electrothrix aestuarii TaxID=3062594 RepID=A0AAU8M0I9_9BACT|nr:hypothetical protein [Candidatus Electrothrix aestuarii]
MKLPVGMASGTRGTYCKNIIFFVAAFSLSACANMSRQHRMYAEPMAISGGIGAGIGAAACKDNRAACAAGGGLLGLGVGAIIGNQHVNHIDQMDQSHLVRKQTINSLQQQIAVMVNYNRRLKRDIEQYERDIRRNIDRRGVAGEELRKAQNAYNGLLSVLARERQAAQRTPNPNQRRIYQNQIGQLEGQIQELDHSIRRLKNITGYGRVGGY